ncbi:MAG: serine/threonine protein kinase [Wenzhouxiangella sp.]|nr:serine/threonine protein kinase [Wenzhouxiangella sp.]TVR96912.1 MAG: hypothetical protein EA418_04480 [Wenzhouxiangellaceae bacterium]
MTKPVNSMDPVRWRRVNELFDQLISIDDLAQRKSRLEAACGEDATLKSEVASLLAAHDASTGFLDQAVVTESAAILDMEGKSRWLGRQIGPWQIEQLIHAGGMGSVYRARRVSGDFAQTAALKLVRMELPGSDQLRRFALEQQVLASLQHPNIAHLLDGGTTEDGVPWLAMEYIDGEPIDHWCNQRRLTVAQRLGLFEQVCDAVSFAHRNLVIHRDIKPDNILVNRESVPKLLDFGIAKLLDEHNIGHAQTITRQRMLTPAYASPEQFLGKPVGTTSDVYSLGMLLYQLLTGQPAYRITAETALPDCERLICRTDPPPPSLTAISTRDGGRAAAERRVSPEQLKRQIKGDLDVIVLKCLRKEPERRYPSVDALIEDIRRYREGFPVSARPDTMSYRASRFARRHWLGLSATTSIMLALGIGLIIAVVQTDKAREERDRTLQINRFLQEILVQADPFETGADATIREVVARADRMVQERFIGQDDLRGSLLRTIGYIQLGLMDLDASEASIREAVNIKHRLYGPNDERSLRARSHLAWIEFRRDRPETALVQYEAIIDKLPHRASKEFVGTLLNDSAVILNNLERYEESIARLERSLALWLAVDPERPDIASIHNNLGYAWHGLGDLEQAEHHYRQAILIEKAASPRPNANLAIALNNLAILVQDLGRLDDALELQRQAMSIRLDTLGPNHLQTALGHLNLGRLLLRMEQPAQARVELQQALSISRRNLEEDSLFVQLSLASLARSDALEGDPLAAAARLRESRQTLERIGAPWPFTLGVGLWQVQALLAAERNPEARTAALRDQVLALEQLGEDHDISMELRKILADLQP